MSSKQTIGLVVGTNRSQAKTAEVVAYYKDRIQAAGHDTVVVDLKTLPADFTVSALYENQGKHESFNAFQAQIDALSKMIFVVPEYNGSFPGVTKAFLDGLRYPDTMNDKKVALVGVASGVQGNAVGLSHLSDILSYMGAHLLGLKVKLGSIYNYFDGTTFSHPKYEEFVDLQIEKFLAF